MVAIMAGLGGGFGGGWRMGVQLYMDLAGGLILSLVTPAVIALAFKVTDPSPPVVVDGCCVSKTVQRAS